MTILKEYSLADEQETQNLGQRLALAGVNTGVIYLIGPLGAGKTTFVRGFLRGLGYAGKVKSPTYSLVESYNINTKTIHHFDFYRLLSPEELELIGIRDYFTLDAICLIEWPERADNILPPADLSCYIHISGSGRHVCLKGFSESGQRWLATME